MKEKALNYYKSGYSCSESVVSAAVDEGFCDASLLSVSTSFSGGMSSGCLCGAVAGAQMVLGSMYGKKNSAGNEESARALAKMFIDEFKKERKATCCKVLSAKYDFNSQERKENCSNIVTECAQIMEDLIKLQESKKEKTC